MGSEMCIRDSYEIGGGIRNGKKLKGVIPGGSSSSVITANEVDVLYNFDELTNIDTMLGSSAMMVFDEDTDVVRSEINDIRKSVVSMSVGQPDRTTTIVKEWLEQPEPTPPAEPEQEAASDSDSGDTEEKEK